MTRLNEIIHEAHQIAFLTGAGVSTASGIPDYRSKRGLYHGNRTPEYMLSHECLINEPKVFYDFVIHHLFFPNAHPNIIHTKMTQLANEQRATVITQNIDNLYQQAGIQPERLVEFHGNLYDVYCQKCGCEVDWHMYLKSMYHQNCGGILRSRVVLYGETIDPHVLQRAVQAVKRADTIIIVGTSFVVYPFAGLIQDCRPDARVVAVNNEPLALPTGGVMIVDDAVKEFEQVKV